MLVRKESKQMQHFSFTCIDLHTRGYFQSKRDEMQTYSIVGSVWHLLKRDSLNYQKEKTHITVIMTYMISCQDKDEAGRGIVVVVLGAFWREADERTACFIWLWPPL